MAVMLKRSHGDSPFGFAGTVESVGVVAELDPDLRR
jgi:hypothetical protein